MIKMKYDILPSSCRVCLRRSKKLRSIYKPLEDEDESPSEMLQNITGIVLEDAQENPALPKSICKSCELSLNLAFQFRAKAIKSQRIIDIYCTSLREKARGHERYAQKVKQELEDCEKSAEDEMYVNEEDLGRTNDLKIEALEMSLSFDEGEADSEEHVEYLLDESFTDMSIPELNAEEIKQTMDSDSQEDEGQNELQNPSKNSAGALEDSEDVVKDEDDIKQEELPSTKSEVGEEEHKVRRAAACKKTTRKRGRKLKCLSEEQKPAAELRSDLNVKSENEDTSVKTKNESGHICDICGNIFAKRGRMMEHRRRHDKELRYTCELCDKSFHLREKLRKHMFIHKGGKPHKCSFCSRTFFYESVKKAHEAIHSGHKPFVCEFCNKAFAYSQALKKHHLIHADIKLYHCEYCDKDFRLQHHMKQHIETRMHQNAVRVATGGNAAIDVEQDV